MATNVIKHDSHVKKYRAIMKSRRYDAKHRELRNEKAARYNAANREMLREKAARYYELNKEKAAAYNAGRRVTRREWERQYYKDNAAYTLARDTLRRLKSVVKTPLRVSKECQRLGYSSTALKEHMESLFMEGMSWDNHGEWHIDHIKPIAAFKAEGITDVAVINALDNLQPLWAVDNLRKGAKY